MMTNLPIGANLPLNGTHWTNTLTLPHDIRHDLGLAILAVNDEKQLVNPPYLAHANAPAWASAHLNEAGTTYTLSLDIAQLPNANSSHLYPCSKHEFCDSSQFGDCINGSG
jgi:hypothetical protein